MDIQHQINQLIQKFSGTAVFEESAEQTLTAQNPVRITGAVVACTEASLAVEVGEVQLEIPIQKLLGIQVNPSTPVAPEACVYVDLQVHPAAKVVERRLRTAAEYGSHLGKRPFVYELPSQTAQFGVAEEDFQVQQSKWLEQVGLVDFQSIMMSKWTTSQTSENTRSDTRSQTARSTSSMTSSPRGSHMDNKTDYQSDSRPDNRIDWKTDQRMDP